MARCLKVVKLPGAKIQLKTGGLNVAGISVNRAFTIVATKIIVSDFVISHLIMVTNDFNWLLTLNSTGSY